MLVIYTWNENKLLCLTRYDWLKYLMHKMMILTVFKLFAKCHHHHMSSFDDIISEQALINPAWTLVWQRKYVIRNLVDILLESLPDSFLLNKVFFPRPSFKAKGRWQGATVFQYQPSKNQSCDWSVWICNGKNRKLDSIWDMGSESCALIGQYD